jgi:hypothetical protein
LPETVAYFESASRPKKRPQRGQRTGGGLFLPSPGSRRSAAASVPRRSYPACKRCSFLTTGSSFLLFPLSIGSHGPKLVSNVPPKLARKRRQLNPASMPLRTAIRTTTGASLLRRVRLGEEVRHQTVLVQPEGDSRRLTAPRPDDAKPSRRVSALGTSERKREVCAPCGRVPPLP